MKLSAIRGAITVEADTKEQIATATVRLFEHIKYVNNIKSEGKIVYVVASSTADITAFYPATALRENGCSAPLFSCQEPQIKDNLPLCIRLMVLAKIKNPKHVYLEKAANLRSDLTDS